MSPEEAKEGRESFVNDLKEGISEARFWSAFVQCLLCKQVTFKDTLATAHTCQMDQTSRQRRRHHPFARAAQRSLSIHARIGYIPGDMPENSGLWSLRSSPAPTEIIGSPANAERLVEETVEHDHNVQSLESEDLGDPALPTMEELFYKDDAASGISF